MNEEEKEKRIFRRIQRFGTPIGFVVIGVGVVIGLVILNDKNTPNELGGILGGLYVAIGVGTIFLTINAIANHKIILKLIGIETKLGISNNTQNREKKEEQNFSHVEPHRVFSNSLNDYRVHFGLGFLILFMAIMAYYLPTFDDRDAVQTWTGFDILHDENVTFSNIQISIVAIDKKQSLHIYYATNEIKTEKPYLIFFIPYLVTMTNSEESLKYSLPGDWKSHQIPDINTTILYKFFDCSEREYCSDQLNMYFDFQDTIDSKQYYVHSVDIPFNSHTHPAVIDFRNDILSLPFSWDGSWNSDRSTLLKVSVLDDSTEYNPIPDGYLEPRKYNQTGVSNSVMVWEIPEHDITFHLDYVNPEEQKKYDSLTAFALVMFGTGTGILVLATAEFFAQRKSIKK